MQKNSTAKYSYKIFWTYLNSKERFILVYFGIDSARQDYKGGKIQPIFLIKIFDSKVYCFFVVLAHIIYNKREI